VLIIHKMIRSAPLTTVATAPGITKVNNNKIKSGKVAKGGAFGAPQATQILVIDLSQGINIYSIWQKVEFRFK